MARAARSRPTAATWSRHGLIAAMPCRAQASMISRSPACLRTVAVLTDSSDGPALRSRIARLQRHAADGQYGLHARRGALGVAEQARLVGQPEQLGEVQGRAGAFLAADHGEMVLMAVEPGQDRKSVV